MSNKILPVEPGQILEWAQEINTPFYVYDEAGIRATARDLNEAYAWAPEVDGVGYLNHFAVKALSNPHIQAILKSEGMGVDTSSGPELEIARAVGHSEPAIFYTANHVTDEEYIEAFESGAIINLDDISQIDRVHHALNGRFPQTISFRYNPGEQRTEGVNEIIGDPEEGKFGTADEHLEAAYRKAMELGATRFGLHAMVVSNELGESHHIDTARMLFNKAVELHNNLGIRFDFINLGGGLGVPYRPDQQPIDYVSLQQGLETAYKEIIAQAGLDPVRIVTENGRHVTGPHGYFIAHVIDVKEGKYRDIGIDAATTSAFPRPALYDAYHHFTGIGADGSGTRKLMAQRIVGSLCEGNDFFTGATTKIRTLPELRPNDVVVGHDAGAHCWEMGSTYNLKLRPAEYLLQMDGTLRLIRRAQVRKDLFSSIEGYEDLK